LTPIATLNSVLVHVTVTADPKNLGAIYAWTLTAVQEPTIVQPSATTGSEVLSYTFSSSSSDKAGLDGAIGTISMTSSYSMNVTFSGAQIIITQHVVFGLGVSFLSSPSGSANIVDRTVVDTYNLFITPEGSLDATLTSAQSNNDFNPSVNPVLNFFTDLNSLTDDIHETIAAFESTLLSDIPLSLIQQFVFPGGATFNFTTVGFSEHQDLVSNIKYNT